MIKKGKYQNKLMKRRAKILLEMGHKNNQDLIMLKNVQMSKKCNKAQ